MLVLSIIRIIQSALLGIFGLLGLIIPGLDNGAVTELPYIQDTVDTFAQTIHGVILIMPWLDIPFKLVLLAFAMKLVLIVFELVLKLISIIRG